MKKVFKVLLKSLGLLILGIILIIGALILYVRFAPPSDPRRSLALTEALTFEQAEQTAIEWVG